MWFLTKVRTAGTRLSFAEHDSVVKTPAEAATTFDYVVCAHKAIGQDAVPAQLEPIVNDDTTIVLIQNGMYYTRSRGFIHS